MAVLTVTRITRAGVLLSDGAAAGAGGDSFPNTGQEYLVVKNASVGSINVTLDIRSTVDSQAVTDPVVAVGAAAEKIIGPFPKSVYNDTSNRVNVTYSAVTDVTVKVIQVA